MMKSPLIHGLPPEPRKKICFLKTIANERLFLKVQRLLMQMGHEGDWEAKCGVVWCVCVCF